MNVRVLSPLGKLLTVEKAVPIIEKTFSFNGEQRFLGESCKAGVKPNGIAIRHSATEMRFPNELVIGNLKSEKVEEIMQSLLTLGYYDFTTLKYQRVKTADKLVLDNGASDAYTNEITDCPYKVYCNNEFAINPFANYVGYDSGSDEDEFNDNNVADDEVMEGESYE